MTEPWSVNFAALAIKSVVLTRGLDAFTETALRGLDAMGINEAAGLSVVLGLQRGMLFKSSLGKLCEL